MEIFRGPGPRQLGRRRDEEGGGGELLVDSYGCVREAVVDDLVKPAPQLRQVDLAPTSLDTQSFVAIQRSLCPVTLIHQPA